MSLHRRQRHRSFDLHRSRDLDQTRRPTVTVYTVNNV